MEDLLNSSVSFGRSIVRGREEGEGGEGDEASTVCKE